MPSIPPIASTQHPAPKAVAPQCRMIRFDLDPGEEIIPPRSHSAYIHFLSFQRPSAHGFDHRTACRFPGASMSLAPKEGPGGQGINAESGLEVDSFSGLEVNWAAQRDGSLPQTVEKSNEIEAVQQTKRVCGLSRKVFWIVLVVAVLVIVGAAVGGGVGASVKSDHSSNDITNDVANSTAAMNAVLPNTKLATFNFTENQADQSCVFFQSSEASLYQSLWNSSTKLWMTAPTVLNGSEVQIKQNTPLAARVRSESSVRYSYAQELRKRLT